MSELEVREEMAEAAGKISTKVLDGKIYVEAKTLVEIAATIAATHRAVRVQAEKSGEELSENQYHSLMGQQRVAMVLIQLYEALMLKIETDEALIGN